jgi:hypothetical protein
MCNCISEVRANARPGMTKTNCRVVSQFENSAESSFVRQRLTDERLNALLDGPYPLKIRPSLSEAQALIRSAEDDISVWLVLTVVLPKAYRTNFVLPPSEKSLEVATRASVGLFGLFRLTDPTNLSIHAPSLAKLTAQYVTFDLSLVAADPELFTPCEQRGMSQFEIYLIADMVMPISKRL